MMSIRMDEATRVARSHEELHEALGELITQHNGTGVQTAGTASTAWDCRSALVQGFWAMETADHATAFHY